MVYLQIRLEKNTEQGIFYILFSLFFRIVPANGLNPIYNEDPFVFRKVILCLFMENKI